MFMGKAMRYGLRGFLYLGGTTQATTQDKILKFCVEARSKAEIAEHCGYRSIKHFTDKFLKPMLASGQLLMTIPDKPTSPEQRYVAADRNAGEAR